LSLAPDAAVAAEWPSLFRGVVVADHAIGIRVVSVAEASQASYADLRPEDILFRINDVEIHSIDDFAVVSLALKGRAASATVLIFRNGQPKRIQLHLYSYPILRAWGIQVVPDHDIRFAQPQTGLDYWRRLGRGFEQVDNPHEALDAYLNGLHNVPADAATAAKVSELLWRLGRQALDAGRLPEGIDRLTQAVTVLERLFDHAMTDEQLEAIRAQLERTLATLRRVKPSSGLDAQTCV